jgi:hypothetical protein
MFTVRATNTFFIGGMFTVCVECLLSALNVYCSHGMFTVRVIKCHPEIPYDEKKIES